VGNAPDGFSRGCVGHSHTSAGHRAGALRVRVRVLRALLPGTHTEGASSYHPAAFQCAMDSPCHPHLSGHALEHGGASAAAIDATQALADAFLQLPVASQHVPSLHNLFLEPCFFLTALFLVHGSLHKMPFTPRKAWNGKVVAIILSCCLPVFLLQLFFVVISPSFEFKGGYSVQKEGYNHRLPNYFTMTFDLVMMDNQTVAVCQYPLLSILVLAVFGVIYSVYFLFLGWQMVGVVINQYLRRHIYGLLAALLFFLPLHVLFLGMTLLSKPTHLVFELLAFLGFLMVLLCTTVGEWILIIRPIADALAVCSVFVSSHHLGQEMESTGGGRSLSISFPAFVSDDDQVALVQHGQINGTDLNSNLEFDTAVNPFMPVDHRGSFSDQNEVAFPSSDSPELPGKPLLSDTQKAFIPFL